MARITLCGFYQYDKTLFDDIVLPDGIEKENLVAEIMRNSGDLYPYHQVPEYLKQNMNYWFARRLFDFSRMYDALRMDYSPIENYDRKENTLRDYENSGIDKASTTLGSSTTSENVASNENENKVSAYNETDYTNRGKDTQTYNSTVTNRGSGTDTTQTEYGLKRKEVENIRVHGNIGVTTSQQMIESEISLRAKYDIYKIISREFEHEFLVQIY